MTFLEPVGKRFKWPTKDDIVDVDIKAIICEKEITPNATGRLWTVQNVDRIDEKIHKWVLLERKRVVYKFS